jgi:molybdenum cofactor cytidylyltransferase
MFRSFGIVPAAGQSARMGAPKLLLPLGGRTVIEHVLAAWTASRVTRTVVVVRGDDATLVERCRRFDVDVVSPPQAPPEMKDSVAFALAHIAARYAPAEDDAWLVAPADVPRLDAATIDAVLAAYDPRRPTAIAPVRRGKRGHPTLLPWAAAGRVRDLAAEEGVNALVARVPLVEFACDAAGVVDDLDVPADYARLADRWPAPANPDETGSAGAGF